MLTNMQQVSRYDMKDEIGKVVLDTGCISNVCGTNWLRSQVNGLNIDSQQEQLASVQPPLSQRGRVPCHPHLPVRG